MSLLGLKDPKFSKLIKGFLLIAPAIDHPILVWNSMTDKTKQELKEKGSITFKYKNKIEWPMTKDYVEDSMKNSFEALGPMKIGCPMVIIQGKRDFVVDLETVDRLVKQVSSEKFVRVV